MEEYMVLRVSPVLYSFPLTRGLIRLSKCQRGSILQSARSSAEKPAEIPVLFTQSSVPAVAKYIPTGDIRSIRMQGRTLFVCTTFRKRAIIHRPRRIPSSAMIHGNWGWLNHKRLTGIRTAKGQSGRRGRRSAYICLMTRRHCRITRGINGIRIFGRA